MAKSLNLINNCMKKIAFLLMMLFIFPLASASSVESLRLDILEGRILSQEILPSQDGTKLRVRVVNSRTGQPIPGNTRVMLLMQFRGADGVVNGRAEVEDEQVNGEGYANFNISNTSGEYFLQVYHVKDRTNSSDKNYHEAFIYEQINPESETGFRIPANTQVSLTVGIAELRGYQKRTRRSGRFSVQYISPAFRRCANLAMERVPRSYNDVKNFLQLDPIRARTTISFNTKAMQGAGDWTAWQGGLSTTCFPMD